MVQYNANYNDYYGKPMSKCRRLRMFLQTRYRTNPNGHVNDMVGIAKIKTELDKLEKAIETHVEVNKLVTPK